ncbi:MAG: metallophosphoesterase family protein [Candidatus Omnitrophota bacterium]
MKYAVLADIHGNWEALKTVENYLAAHDLRSIVVLGDIVGYGADPNLCFEWVEHYADVIIGGNHEWALLDPQVRSLFTEEAGIAIDWTDGVLAPRYWEIMRALPYVRIERNVTLVHGALDIPEAFDYLFSYQDAIRTFQAMTTPVCFTGHTHIPSLISEKAKRAWTLSEGAVKIPMEGRSILNPGSVGQPRDRDPRASFAVADTETGTFEIVRLHYENHLAADKILKAGLPPFLAERLL